MATTEEQAMIDAKAARDIQADPFTTEKGTVNIDRVVSELAGFGLRVDVEAAARAGLNDVVLKALAKALPGLIATATNTKPADVKMFSELNKGFVRQQSRNRVVSALETSPEGRAALAAKKKGGK